MEDLQIGQTGTIAQSSRSVCKASGHAPEPALILQSQTAEMTA